MNGTERIPLGNGGTRFLLDCIWQKKGRFWQVTGPWGLVFQDTVHTLKTRFLKP